MKYGPSLFGRRALAFLIWTAFFGVFFAYVYWSIDPRLMYFRQGPVFYFGWQFLQPFLDHPGGATQYAAAFIGQWLQLRGWGALVLTLGSAMLSLATAMVLARLRIRWGGLFCLVPPLSLLFFYHDYNFSLSAVTGLVMAALVTMFYILVMSGTRMWRVVSVLALAAALGWIAAWWALVFVVLAVALEIWYQRDESRPVRRLPWLVLPVLGTMALIALTLYPLQMRREKVLLEIGYYAEEQQWQEVLSAARRLKGADLFARSDIIRALYATGRLSEDLLDYPISVTTVQPPPSLEKFVPYRQFATMSDWLFDLGRVNEAEHAAYEALELAGERPAILKRLVLIHVAKGQPAAARVYLSAIEKTVFGRGWVQSYRRAHDVSPEMIEDERVQQAWSLMDKTDVEVPPEEALILVRALQTNPRNRMALEYLMTHYLLTGQLFNLAEAIGRLPADEYPVIPRLWEEALVAYMSSPNAEPVDLGGRTIRPETVERHRSFFGAISFLRNPRTASAWNGLKTNYGNTYWFLMFFGSSAAAGPFVPATTTY